MEIGLYHYLTVAAALFALGLINVATRKNAIGILLGIELILNAASINFVAFSQFSEGSISGQVMSVFIITLAAAETVVALAIVVAVWRRFNSIDAEKISRMKL
ncbi:MAG: NADH-quinone oxidoreductase subunit NuoK [Deltaproteobacteria bacterium]|nr:NADH-quinone oxidoreductase subunit NuoK [Deltaproteobacteria bacterium]